MSPYLRRAGLLTAALVLVVAVLGLVIGSGGSGRDTRTAPVARDGVGPYPARAVPPGYIRDLGVTTEAFANNSLTRWGAADLSEVDVFEQQALRHADVLMWFADWEHVLGFDAAQAAAVARRGAIPEIAWEPWDSTRGSRQPRYRLRTIIDGRHDAYISRWARQIARYGGPVRIRFAQEMNGDWYPWSESANGNRHGEYVRAWRHVRAVFRRAGAANVRWEWCPVAGSVPRRLFPGTAQVDILGIAGFNGGPHLFDHSWDSFRSDFGPALERIHSYAPALPVVVSEVGSTESGGDKAAWITGMFRDLRRRPYVRGVTWFNVRKESDWRIASSPAARWAFVRAVGGR